MPEYDNLGQIRRPIEEAAYDAWKRQVWRQPLSGGMAGCMLVTVSVAVTLGGMVMAAVIYNSSSHIRAPVWAHLLAYVFAGAGALSFVSLRPLVWRMTREYRQARRRESQTLYFLQYEATPAHDHPDTNEIAGAIVNSWVFADDEVEANMIVQTLIEEAGWIVGDPDQTRSVGPESVAADDPSLSYVAQAGLDGEVLVFHTWPVDELEGVDD